MQSEKLIEFSTKIVYRIDGLSSDLKVYWNRFLAFSFSDALSHTQIRQLEIRAAAHPFKNSIEISLSLTELSDEEQTWILAALKFLQAQASVTKDWISHRNIENLIIEITPAGLSNSIIEKQGQISSAFSEFERRKVFLIPGSLSIILIDYALRWILLTVGIPSGITSNTVFGLNFVFVLPMIILAWWWAKRDKRLNAALIKKNGFGGQYNVRFSYTTLQYTLLGFCVVTGGTICYLIQSDSQNSLGFGSSLFLILYYFFFIKAFPIGRLSEHDLLTQVHDVNDVKALDADGNDEAIVLLETELNSKTGRLEAYVLESALFGALAFSGFLQIIATNLISFADLERFAGSLYKVSQAAALSKWVEYDQFAVALKTQVNLFCLISIETLICSAFFLAVISARLRFSNIADKVRSAINLAKAFNDKEEIMLGSSVSDPSNTVRFKSINRKIAGQLHIAKEYLLKIEPIVGYMIYFRNAGLFTFLTVLVSSSLFITSTLAWGFIYIGIATWIYFNLEAIRARLVASSLSLSVLFTRHNRLLFGLAILPALLGFALRVGFKWNNTDPLIATSFILTVLYCYVWLVLMPHHDRWFENTDQKENDIWQSRRWLVIKNIYGVLILLAGLIFGLIAIDRPGAAELLLSDLLWLIILNFFIVPYLVRPKWLGFIVAVFLGVGISAILFKMIHLAEANLLASVSLITFFLY